MTQIRGSGLGIDYLRVGILQSNTCDQVRDEKKNKVEVERLVLQKTYLISWQPLHRFFVGFPHSAQIAWVWRSLPVAFPSFQYPPLIYGVSDSATLALRPGPGVTSFLSSLASGDRGVTYPIEPERDESLEDKASLRRWLASVSSNVSTSKSTGGFRKS